MNQGELQLNELAMIVRIYAEEGVSQPSLFVTLAEQVSDNISKLDLNTFVDAYIALNSFRTAQRYP